MKQEFKEVRLENKDGSDERGLNKEIKYGEM